jgi:replicative DNA helicase
MGISGIDRLLKGGLAKGEIGVILAPTGVGKALPVSEPVLTPQGWVDMGELELGDEVVGSDGQKQYVIGVYPQGVRPIYKVEFTDGTFVNCDEEHLWGTYINGEYSVNKTSEIINGVKDGITYNLPQIKPISFIKNAINDDPYNVGVNIKDGLKDEYLYNTIDVREKVLQGIVDTYGCVNDNGEIELDINVPGLRELVLSLGGFIDINENRCIITFKNNIRPFSSKDDLLTYDIRNNTLGDKVKSIKSVTYSHDEEAVCIKVSNSDELFVTRDYVLTHNTTLMTKITNHAFNMGYNVLQIFFEDNPKIIQRKHITLWTKIHPDELTNKRDEVMKKVEDIQTTMPNKLILQKLSSDSLTMLQIKNMVRKMIADGVKLDMITLDYIDCVLPDKNLGDEWKSEGAVIRGFEAMCHELDIVGWTATQGNRSSISSEVVTTDQMGGSIKKAQVGHVIITVAKTLAQKEAKLATMAITKSRIGDDGIVFENCKFDNGMLEIDTESSVTFLGHEEQQEQRNRDRIRELMDKRKEKEQNKS